MGLEGELKRCRNLRKHLRNSRKEEAMELVRFIEEETKVRYQISTYATKIRADNDIRTVRLCKVKLGRKENSGLMKFYVPFSVFEIRKADPHVSTYTVCLYHHFSSIFYRYEKLIFI